MYEYVTFPPALELTDTNLNCIVLMMGRNFQSPLMHLDLYRIHCAPSVLLGFLKSLDLI
jgi:hypothetical protein